MNRALKPETVWTIALAAAVLLFVVSIGFAIMPKPTAAGVEASKRKQSRAILESVASAKASEQSMEGAIKPLIWQEEDQAIGAKALATVSSIAKASGLKLTAFRPQRLSEGKGLAQLPFLVFVEGGYPKVLSFIRKLESPAGKLAINSVQVASSDGASDEVTASIVLVAFRKAQK